MSRRSCRSTWIRHEWANRFAGRIRRTAPAVLRDVRKTYEGPLALAQDYMVFNVTKDDIKVRMAAVEEAV